MNKHTGPANFVQSKLYKTARSGRLLAADLLNDLLDRVRVLHGDPHLEGLHPRRLDMDVHVHRERPGRRVALGRVALFGSFTQAGFYVHAHPTRPDERVAQAQQIQTNRRVALSVTKKSHVAI